MLHELFFATILVTFTVMVHGIGLVALARFLRLETRHAADEHIHPGSLRGMLVLLIAILALIGLHGMEIWIYAIAYVAIGAIESLRNAVYFSTITYGAIGYSDHLMADRWRLVSAIEGINGIIMIGWSTAFLIRMVPLLRRA